MKKQEANAFKPINWPLPDEYLIELGRVVSAWISLESYVDVCIGKLTGYEITDVRPFIVLRHSSFPQRLDSMEALCDFISERGDKLKNYKAVIAQIRAAQTSRNKLLHNTITKHPESGKFQLSQGSARGKVKLNFSDITPDDIKLVAMEIHVAQLALHELITGVKVPPLWKRKGTKYEQFTE